MAQKLRNTATRKDTTKFNECKRVDGLSEGESSPEHDEGKCSLSLRRVAHGSKRMRLELIHGLFIT